LTDLVSNRNKPFSHRYTILHENGIPVEVSCG
jgi:hypothetical protein